MKKKNLKSLRLLKESIADLKGGDNSIDPAIEISERRTNCDQCPAPDHKCYTEHGGLSCGSMCTFDPNYSLPCSKFF